MSIDCCHPQLVPPTTLKFTAKDLVSPHSSSMNLIPATSIHSVLNDVLCEGSIGLGGFTPGYSQVSELWLNYGQCRGVGWDWGRGECVHVIIATEHHTSHSRTHLLLT